MSDRKCESEGGGGASGNMPREEFSRRMHYLDSKFKSELAKYRWERVVPRSVDETLNPVASKFALDEVLTPDDLHELESIRRREQSRKEVIGWSVEIAKERIRKKGTWKTIRKGRVDVPFDCPAEALSAMYRVNLQEWRTALLDHDWRIKQKSSVECCIEAMHPEDRTVLQEFDERELGALRKTVRANRDGDWALVGKKWLSLSTSTRKSLPVDRVRAWVYRKKDLPARDDECIQWIVDWRTGKSREALCRRGLEVALDYAKKRGAKWREGGQEFESLHRDLRHFAAWLNDPRAELRRMDLKFTLRHVAPQFLAPRKVARMPDLGEVSGGIQPPLVVHPLMRPGEIPYPPPVKLCRLKKRAKSDMEIGVYGGDHGSDLSDDGRWLEWWADQMRPVILVRPRMSDGEIKRALELAEVKWGHAADPVVNAEIQLRALRWWIRQDKAHEMAKEKRWLETRIENIIARYLTLDIQAVEDDQDQYDWKPETIANWWKDKGGPIKTARQELKLSLNPIKRKATRKKR